jgi:hypothetical protein
MAALRFRASHLPLTAVGSPSPWGATRYLINLSGGAAGFFSTPRRLPSGAQVRRGQGQITIGGVRNLRGQRVVAGESRAAAAYVVAGLCAEGSTRIVGTEHLERVYSDLADKLRSLGADLSDTPEPSAGDPGSGWIPQDREGTASWL